MNCFNSSDYLLLADYCLASLRVHIMWKPMFCWRILLLQCAVGLTALYKNVSCKLEKRLSHYWFCFWRSVFRLCYVKGFFKRNSFFLKAQQMTRAFGRYSTVQGIFFFLNISVWVLSLQQTYRFKPFCSIHVQDTNEMQKPQLGEISRVFSLSQFLLSHMQLRFDLSIRELGKLYEYLKRH